MRCGIAAGVAALIPVAATVRAQDGGIGTEVFFGGGGFVVEEKVYSFDVGATAWLTERWGLGAWTSFPSLVGESETDGGLLFNPAVRTQRRLRRGRSLHLAAGPGYGDGSDAPVRFVFIPYADVLGSMGCDSDVATLADFCRHRICRGSDSGEDIFPQYRLLTTGLEQETLRCHAVAGSER